MQTKQQSAATSVIHHGKRLACLAALLALPMLAQANMPMGGMMGMGGMGGEENCMGKGAHGAHHHHHGKKDFLPHFLRGIDLSQAQQDKIKELMQKHLAEGQNKGEAAFKQHRTLHDLAFAPKFNEAEAKRLANEIAQSQSEMMLSHIKLEQQIFASLTPEQQSKVTSNMKELATKMEERMAKREAAKAAKDVK